MATSIARQIVERVVTEIKALGLTTFNDNTNISEVVAAKSVGEIEEQFAATSSPPHLPAIAVMLSGSVSVDPLGPTPVGFDDIGYPVLILFLAALSEGLTQSDDAYLADVETVRKNLIRQRLSTIAHACVVESSTTVNPILFRERCGLWAFPLRMRFIAREARV